MTTKDSPHSSLKSQADRIAATLKQAESGHRLPRKTDKPDVTFGVVMDDKVLKITMLWSVIAETNKEALAEYIVTKMREEHSH